ncbi:MAG TPA: acetyl-CoA carboxylase, carboxyltransferase subunit beta [Crocinitomicaceae bacterium]|jgi:acetyl-CoA carboxylase carboxyl transferase subunit beta|nr:acetyl-CoA carboxylase, carboxyltransferase subunit beta [Crocinitomicaceae bacterium]
MVWFKREKQSITTSTNEKMEVPEGIWHKCPKCKTVFTEKEFEKSLYICDRCGHHERIGSKEYFEILFDDNKFKELDKDVTSGDPLKFKDTKEYADRVKSTIKKTGLKDAVRTGHGKIDGQDLVIACMDFNFIGGSLGSVVGEKIARAIDYAIKKKAPFLMISKSGGARMMEAGFSLMQMAKVSGKLGQLSEHGLPYISLLTDPTTGGVTASFAMLGDINIAEPNALIAFAGPRVVKETIGRELPDGFQTSEFLLEHGFLDYIVDRHNLKKEISHSIKLFNS